MDDYQFLSDDLFGHFSGILPEQTKMRKNTMMAQKKSGKYVKEDPSGQPEPEKSRFLKGVAWLMSGCDLYNGAYAVAATSGLTGKRVKELLNEYAESGELEVRCTDRGKKIFSLPVAVQAKWIGAIMDECEKWKDWYDSNNIRLYSSQWENFFQRFILEGKVSTLLSMTDETEYLPLLCALLRDDRWLPFISNFKFEQLRALFTYMTKEWTYDLQPVDEAAVRHILVENKGLDDGFRNMVDDSLYFIKHLYAGHLDTLGTHEWHTPKMFGNLTKAIMLQHRGRIDEALKAYYSAIHGTGMPCFVHPLLDTYYMLALLQANTAETQKKINTIGRNSKLARDSVYSCPRLLLQSIAKQAESKEVALRRYGQSQCALERLLVLLLARHFHIDQDIKADEAALCALIDTDDTRLLQLECSAHFPTLAARADAVRERIGLAPVLSSIEVSEKWERALDEIMALLKDEETKSTDKDAKKLSRVIYLVDDKLNVQPKIQRSKDGIKWTKGQNCALSRFAKMEYEEMEAQDREVAKCVEKYDYYDRWGDGEQWELSGERAFRALAGHPRVFAMSSPDTPVSITLEQPQITIKRVADGFAVKHSFSESELRDGLKVTRENSFRFHVTELTLSQRTLINTLSTIGHFPSRAEKRLASTLPTISRQISVQSDLVPTTQDIKQVKADSHITVMLQPQGNGFRAELFVKPLTDRPPYCHPALGNANILGDIDGTPVCATRDLKAEKKNKTLATGLLVNFDCDNIGAYHLASAAECLDMLDLLRQHSDQLRTEWPEGVKLRIKSTADLRDLHIRVGGTVGQWFDIDGELHTDDGLVLQIAEILAQTRQTRGRFIELKDGEFLALTDSLRKQLQDLDPFVTETKGKLRIPAVTATALSDIEASGAELTKSSAFADLTARIALAAETDPTVPKALCAELRPYQVEGYQWLARLATWGAGACLADDMGLGKTVQTIAVLLRRATEGPSLVIAPVSVLPNWEAELRRFAPTLRPVILNGTGTDRTAAVGQAAHHDIVLATYGLLVTETELLTAKKWNAIVLDEAHTIKNKETKTSKAAMLLDGQFRLILTGTPLQNHLGEIWNLFQFTNPGLLGTFEQFTDRFITPVERNHDHIVQRQLKRLLQPFILRRTKTEVLDELPRKTDITLRVELSDEESALYETLRRQALANIESQENSAMQALAEITRLRLAACHPDLVSPSLHLPSSKTEAFVRLVDELTAANHRALVFSQFTSHLALIRQRLDEASVPYLYLDGSTPQAERNRLVQEFQTGDQPLFLISLKAGGLGLNLTAADYVIHLDPWWNPAIEDQASDRAYRIGQTRPVTIYRLIAAHTIEEKILQLHATKKSLADALLDGTDMAHRLTRDEMLALLRESGQM